jgi:hypothetical protein
MTEITDLSTTDSSNTDVSGYSTVGSIANMGTTDNLFQAILGMLARSTRTNIFRIRDNTTPTKQIAFNASGITAGQTRTFAVPDVSATIAIQPAVLEKNANYSVLAADRAKCIRMDATAANRTVTLPLASSVGNGFTIVVKRYVSSSTNNTVTIARTGTDTIDAPGTDRVLATANQSMALVSDGVSNWYVAASRDPVESGSNANGEYVKYVDGVMETFGTVASGSISTSSGPIWVSAAQTHTFPQPFVAAPRYFTSVRRNVVAGVMWGIDAGDSLSATSVQVRAGATASGGTADIYVLALGRWY